MPADDFPTRYGPTALVVGAAAGLGASYSRQLADRGLDLLLVDRDPAALDELVATLPAGAEHRVLEADLARPDAVDEIIHRAGALDVGLLVANAASSHVGWFREQPWESIEAQIAVNIRATTALVHGLLPRLSARERAGIVLMSSQSSRRGAPLVASYAGTKAYLAILAESLWDELRDDGVDVLGVLPGSTRTPGWLTSMPQSGLGTTGVMDPDDVVREALDTLGRGQPTLIAGAGNRDSDALLDSMPRADAVQMVGQVMRDMYPDERGVDSAV